jgi:hypothetical protein
MEMRRARNGLAYQHGCGTALKMQHRQVRGRRSSMVQRCVAMPVRRASMCNLAKVRTMVQEWVDHKGTTYNLRDLSVQLKSVGTCMRT